ncbi:transcriptional attenuator, LytR family [Tessaracoccus bendigoensis DSM 12906]|uniref:Transcriptional attenuator, LytR family n=1 Tax=Tessaracoccus bendigoensis DSM 12906 TaxID=1123357 RepID=A0A1M6NHP1_9ACTN|nr:LCP family protein [Tessaracoccus bendigoensis]SHJ95261.1 transcriptional attenuator, LytR family [Tessaracoccus bendigoensis DSM 12906]
MNDAERPHHAARPVDGATPTGAGHARQIWPGHAAEGRAPRQGEHRSGGPDSGAPQRRHLRSSLLLTLASAVIPGSGLLGAPRRGHKMLGALTAIVSVVTLTFVLFWAVTDLPRLARVAGNETFLGLATFALIFIAIAWVGLITLTQLTTRPTGLRGGKRLLSAVVVTGLAFCVAAPTAVAARYSHDTARALDSVLKSKDDVKANNQPTIAGGLDPWADQKRVNILLLGGDGSASRAEQVAKYSIRTDTIMVASIDTKTGNTTLIQIPRNVQYTPFPEGSEMAAAFPDGFRGDGAEGEWYVNTIWQHVELDYPDLMAGSTYRGAEALKQGVEGITGLEINQFVLLNIDGLEALINAMGGVTVNINQELAVGGDTAKGTKPKRYLQPGPNQHLNGQDAMWYARSRWNTDDYNRMARQSCLVKAIIDQANPQTLLTNFEAIIKASADMLATDITDDQLSAYIDLAFRVKDGGTISRLVFSNGNNGYSYSDPDFEKMRAAVAKAIEPTPTPTAAAPTTTSATSNSTASAPDPSASASEPSNEGVHNVSDACAWQGEG